MGLSIPRCRRRENSRKHNQQLYQRNTFRGTGLPTHADPKTVWRRQRQVRAALEAGADVDLGHSLPVWGPRNVSTAFDQISSRTRTSG
jgi:hypothetical protein